MEWHSEVETKGYLVIKLGSVVSQLIADGLSLHCFYSLGNQKEFWLKRTLTSLHGYQEKSRMGLEEGEFGRQCYEITGFHFLRLVRGELRW